MLGKFESYRLPDGKTVKAHVLAGRLSPWHKLEVEGDWCRAASVAGLGPIFEKRGYLAPLESDKWFGWLSLAASAFAVDLGLSMLRLVDQPNMPLRMSVANTKILIWTAISMYSTYGYFSVRCWFQAHVALSVLLLLFAFRLAQPWPAAIFLLASIAYSSCRLGGLLAGRWPIQV